MPMKWLEKLISMFSINDTKTVQLNIVDRRLSWYGTKSSAWFIFEEYNDKFIDRYQRYQTFFRMDQDNCLYRLRNSIKLSKLATNFYVEPYVDENGKTSPKDEEVAKLINKALFEKMQRRSFIDQITLYIRDWFSLFEVFFEKDWKNYRPKLTRLECYSVFKWKQTDWTPWVQQIVRYSKDNNEMPKYDENVWQNNIDIPASKLLLFNINQEGINYEWFSLYRKIAKDWFMKDKLENYHAVYQERFWVPPVKATVPQWAEADKIAQYQQTAENLRSHESWFVTKYVDENGNTLVDFELMQWATQNGTMLIDAIKYYEQCIMDSFFAQFLYLWKSTKWSYGLGDASMRFYFHAVKSLLEDDLEIINKYLIPKIVALNFWQIDRMPKVKFGNLWFVEEKWFTDIIANLITNWVVTNGYDIENYTRELLNLPKLSEEEYDKAQEEKKQALEQISNKWKPWMDDEEDGEEEVVPEDKKNQEKKKPQKKKTNEFSKIIWMFSHKEVIESQLEWYSPKETVAKNYSDVILEDSRRPLTFAERKVNIKNINANHDKKEKELEEKLNEIFWRQIEDLSNQVERIVSDNDIKGIADINAKYTNDMKEAVSSVYRDNFDYGKSEVSRELGVEVPKTRLETRALINVQVANVAEAMTAKVANIAKTIITEKIVKQWLIEDTPAVEVTAIVKSNIEEYYTQAKWALNTISVWQAFNSWRMSVANWNTKNIYGAQYSAILDWRTSKRCLSLDGRVTRIWSSDYVDFTPPQHINCRSMRVYILNNEEYKPDIEDFPWSIPVKDTITSKEWLKAPVVDKSSPAVRQIKKEIAEREKKLENQNWQRKEKNQQIINRLKEAIS